MTISHTHQRRMVSLLAMLFAFALLTAACSSSDTATTSVPDDSVSTTTPPGDAAGACATLATKKDGVLTVATGEPAFPPWMGVGEDKFDDLEAGTGYEGALVYAIADKLGLDVEWKRTGFDEAIAPGSKDWDFNIQQYTITEDRDKVVDFSDGYYTVDMAIIGAPDGPGAGATSLEDLKDLKLGAAIGTTALTYIDDVIKPTSGGQVYDDNSALEAAFNAGQVDLIVTDLPTAYFMTGAHLTDAAVLGVLPQAGDDPQELGMLFEEGSPLVDCINETLAELRSEGVLDKLEAEYLQQGGSVPTLAK